MKKLITLTLVIVLALSLLAACGGNENSNNAIKKTNSRSTPKVAIPFIYEEAQPFSEGLAAVKSGGRWGYIDKDGNEVIRCVLGYAYPFSNGLARVGEQEKWGFIDRTGNFVVPIGTYREGNHFSDGLALVERRYFIDTEGNIVIPQVYIGVFSFYDGLARVVKDSEDGGPPKAGFIDKAGNEVIPLKYDAEAVETRPLPPVPSPDGLFLVQLNGKNIFVDRTGNEVISSVDGIPSGFNDGMAPINRSGAWGFIDKQGNDAIPAQYARVEHFSEGLAMVVYKGMVGFVDKTGNEVIPPQYSEVSEGFRTYFNEGLAMVVSEEGAGFIDKTGKIVIPFGEYTFPTNVYTSSLSYFSEGLVAASDSDGRWGYIAIRK